MAILLAFSFLVRMRKVEIQTLQFSPRRFWSKRGTCFESGWREENTILMRCVYTLRVSSAEQSKQLFAHRRINLGRAKTPNVLPGVLTGTIAPFAHPSLVW